MTDFADRWPHVSRPSATPVLWLAHCANQKTFARVKAVTWMAARAESMRLLGCGPDELTVERVEEVANGSPPAIAIYPRQDATIREVARAAFILGLKPHVRLKKTKVPMPLRKRKKTKEVR